MLITVSNIYLRDVRQQLTIILSRLSIMRLNLSRVERNIVQIMRNHVFTNPHASGSTIFRKRKKANIGCHRYSVVNRILFWFKIIICYY